MRSPLRLAALLAAAALPLVPGFACKPDLACGRGTHQEGSVCVADSTDGAAPADAGGARDASGEMSDAGRADGSAPPGRDASAPLGDVGFALRCTDGWGCPAKMLCRGDRCVPAPDPCGSDLECPGGLYCDYGKCVVQCSENAYCPTDRICVEKRCVPPPATCVGDGDCPALSQDTHCNAGACESACTPPCGCREGFECKSGRCAPTAADGSCTTDEPCSCNTIMLPDDGRHCFGGRCGRTCTRSCDCQDGLLCSGGHCVAPPPVCASDADCDCSKGTPLRCVLGLCLKPCAANCDCVPPTESGYRPVCVDGFCQVPPKTCTSAKDCPCSGGHQATCSQGACTYGSCTTSCDCPQGMVCPSGTCVPKPNNGSGCSTDGDCRCGVPCLPLPGIPMSFCGCSRNYDCPGGICDQAAMACEAAPATCASNADCPWNGAYEYCLADKCTACFGGNGPCYGDDANCGTCDDGTKMICHQDPATPDDGSSHCGPPCRSNLDCVSVNFADGICVKGRCSVGGPDLTKPCRVEGDCPVLMWTPLGVAYVPTCQEGVCLPPSCKTNCDCPSSYPGPFVCRSGACEAAPAKCATVDDCACENMGQVACREGGVCGTQPY